MAKLRKVAFKIPGIHETHVEYGHGGGDIGPIFFIRMPDEMMEFAKRDDRFKTCGSPMRGQYNKIVFWGKAEDEVVGTVKECAIEYIKASEKKTKMIRIFATGSSKNIKDRYCSYWDNGHDPLEIKFNYAITYRHKIGKSTYYTNEKGKRDSVDDEWVLLEWTKEREDFCKDLYAAMEKMIRSLKKLLGTRKAATKTIDSRLKLLAPPPSPVVRKRPK